ncbi:MAG: substrate-binding domain-containing protein, partial [Burkholderiales bacterium]
MYRALGALFFLLQAWIAPQAAAEELLIPGAGPPERLVRALANAFNLSQSAHRASVPQSSGIAGALLAIESEGGALARFPRPLNAAEASRGLREVLFARDAVVFAVGAAVGLRDISTRQLGDIYSGKITNWKDLNASPGEIR